MPVERGLAKHSLGPSHHEIWASVPQRQPWGLPGTRNRTVPKPVGVSSQPEPATSPALGIPLPRPPRSPVPCPGIALPCSPPAFPLQPPRGEPPIRLTSTTCAGGPGKRVPGGEGGPFASPSWPEAASSLPFSFHTWLALANGHNNTGRGIRAAAIGSRSPPLFPGRQNGMER